jgi:NAD+ diphosphatase
MLPLIDRAGHLRTDLSKLEGFLSDDQSLIVPVWRDACLMQRESDVRITLAPLPLGGNSALLEDRFELVFLGLLEGRPTFALDVSALNEPLAHGALRGRGEFIDLRAAGILMPDNDAQLAAYARAMLSWHRRHQFCATCGQPSLPRRGGHVRVCRDEGCKSEHFPRTDPAVIMLVQDGDRCLLGRQRAFPPGLYSTLAGFVEAGETLEQAVSREVEEESGVQVKDVRYFGSQPWPFPSSLMLGFLATATTTELHIDGEELEDCRWVTRAELRAPEGFWVPTSYSIASRLLKHFLEG